MNITCRFCGADVDSSAKICLGCGKVMPSYRGSEVKYKSSYSKQDENDGLTAGRIRTQTPYAANRSGRQMDKIDMNYGTPKARREHLPENYVPKKDKRKPAMYSPTGSGKQATRSVIAPGISHALGIIFLIIIGLLLYALIRVFIVSRSSYDFNLDKSMTLESETYGEAFSNYFPDDHRWWFDFSTNKVTFSGTDSDGKKYEMVFGRTNDGQTAVKTLIIDGRKIDSENIMKNYILCTFMVKKEFKHASALGKGLDNKKRI